MKFKVGDKVMVREDLEVNKFYSNSTFVDGMEKFKGMIATIISLSLDCYVLDIDGACFYWGETMLEHYKELYKEHYAKEIIEIAVTCEQLAVNRHTKKPIPCPEIVCEDCVSRYCNDCSIKIKEWANSEYVS